LLLRVLRPFGNDNVDTIKINGYEVILMDRSPRNDPFFLIDKLIEANLAKVDDEDRFCEFDDNGEPLYGNPIFGDLLEMDQHSVLQYLTGSNTGKADIVEEKPKEKKKKDIVTPKLPVIAKTNPFLSDSLSEEDPKDKLPRLYRKFMTPHTTWRQDDFFIYLRISANDVTKYKIEVTDKSIMVALIENGEKKMLLHNLFARIAPEHTTHEVRGLFIVVNLVKFVEHLTWPSLTDEELKNQFITHVVDVSDDDDEDDESSIVDLNVEPAGNRNIFPIEEGDPIDRDSPSNNIGHEDLLALDL
jgi:hypothetical protein